MAGRTIQESRRMYEEALPRLSDHLAKQYRERIAEAEKRAREQADEFIAAREQEVLAMRDAALRELTEVRDSYDDLTAAGSEARISAHEYTAQLESLRTRQTNAEEQLRRAEEVVDVIAAVEEDPIAWFDDLAERLPQLKATLL